MSIIAPDVMRKSDSAFWRLQQSKDAEWAERWQEWHKAIEQRPDYAEWYARFIALKNATYQAYVHALSAVTVPTKRAAIKRFLTLIAEERNTP